MSLDSTPGFPIGDSAVMKGTAGGLVPASSAGMRNLLINGNPVINQRGYVSGTPTTANFQYTVDRWQVCSSGQSLSWTDNLGVRTYTAPSLGIQQPIEAAAFRGGQTYTLNWNGTARGFIGQQAVAFFEVQKGVPFTLPGGTMGIVYFENGTISLPQLEVGSIATTFEARPPALERMLCKAYAQWIPFNMAFLATAAGQTLISPVAWPEMRVAPTASAIQADPSTTQSAINTAAATVLNATPYGGSLSIAGTAAGSVVTTGYRVLLTAEL